MASFGWAGTLSEAADLHSAIGSEQAPGSGPETGWSFAEGACAKLPKNGGVLRQSLTHQKLSDPLEYSDKFYTWDVSE